MHVSLYGRNFFFEKNLLQQKTFSSFSSAKRCPTFRHLFDRKLFFFVLPLTMFEAELARAATFKKIVTAFQDFVTEAAFDCSDEGMSLQASDDHGTIVTFNMDQKAFLGYQCDRIITIGINLNWLVQNNRFSVLNFLFTGCPTY